MIARIAVLCLGALLVAACQRNDLADPPADLGDFALGLNIVVADHAQKVPISREASVEEWEAVMKKAIDDRFGRYEGTKLYNLGISVDGYALAPPGIPVVVAPKSVVAITANIWDDAAGRKLNETGEKMTVFESLTGGSIVGSGYTMSKDEQMEALAYNAAKRVEGWLLGHPEWFGLPPRPPEPRAARASDK
ncbi:hypothetical protein LV780_11700 [Cereibacter azotoformans]|uniref:DUF4410 domain-containing protein n=1 Tax=Cereibacter azotoformans TaxID=43057 RepID=A0A2T5K7E1_9RHOB|nr:hypothetical protein [Cereibacter azotoformans]AXQ94420.1 hypothetical protein D0Z66_11725 [Cereibacter sphaeroides]MBO4170747.1 hypothetical protein [Cereibacter azotoformans]PTR18320.1 hypothetical protein C8J28_10840 [Cereibacter azotoformans]UIJ29963.1 hypothetical protein LV780_11700 [Cereibacter azotoformans]